MPTGAVFLHGEVVFQVAGTASIYVGVYSRIIIGQYTLKHCYCRSLWNSVRRIRLKEKREIVVKGEYIELSI